MCWTHSSPYNRENNEPFRKGSWAAERPPTLRRLLIFWNSVSTRRRISCAMWPSKRERNPKSTWALRSPLSWPDFQTNSQAASELEPWFWHFRSLTHGTGLRGNCSECAGAHWWLSHLSTVSGQPAMQQSSRDRTGHPHGLYWWKSLSWFGF